MAECPRCHEEKFMTVESAIIPHMMISEPEPLYQYRYPGRKGYRKPVCSDCYDIQQKEVDKRNAAIGGT